VVWSTAYENTIVTYVSAPCRTDPTDLTVKICALSVMRLNPAMIKASAEILVIAVLITISLGLHFQLIHHVNAPLETHLFAYEEKRLTERINLMRHVHRLEFFFD